MHRWMIEKKCGISVRIPLKGFRLSYCVNRSIVVITEIQNKTNVTLDADVKPMKKPTKLHIICIWLNLTTKTYQLLLFSLFDFITLHPPPLAASGS